MPINQPKVDFTVASLSQRLLGGSRRTIRRGRLLGSAAVADQQDRDGHEHRVTIAVEAVVAAGAGKSFRGAAAAVDTRANARRSCMQRQSLLDSARLNCQCVKPRCIIATHRQTAHARYP